MGEADGRALPLAFAFTCSTDGNTAPGAKDRMLQAVSFSVSHSIVLISYLLTQTRIKPS